MKKYNKTEPCGLPNVDALRSALNGDCASEARRSILALFDDDTFVETSAYAKRGISDFLSTERANEFESVITGYGAVDGKLTFAFAEDASRMGGAIDERHAKKIADLYRLATENGAPMIGIFNSNGTDIFEGTVGLAAYGRIMSSVAKASGVIPQIAYVNGKCIGASAAIAAMFDFVVKESTAQFYVSSPIHTGVENAQDYLTAFTGDGAACADFIRRLVSFIPENCSSGITVTECADNLNRKLGELDLTDEPSVLSVLADNGVYQEISHSFAPSVTTAFTTIGGVRCGVVMSVYSENQGRLNVGAAKKISRFVNYCDAFSIPLITLVNSAGLEIDKENEKQCFASELARLAHSYSVSTMPKVTVIVEHAIGAAFTLLGSKALGADVVYSLDNAEIGALPAESGVAFAWDKYITLENSREDLVAEWKANVASPAVAAASGEIDDIITTNELRARLCSALLMLSSKGCVKKAKRTVFPL